jgi:crotonobetainyl-CoA:carnitine CoA-transferase CaiB-like acyl-CoA transferase
MALLDVATAVTANQAMNYLASAVAPRRMGNAHPNIVPYQVFACADGHAIVAVGNDAQFRRFCAILGLDALGTDPRFATNPARLGHREVLVPLLQEPLRRLTRDELLSACEAQGVPAGPINDMADVFADPQVVARRLQIEPGGVPGVRTPILFSESPLALDTPSPRLGEHQGCLDAPWD